MAVSLKRNWYSRKVNKPYEDDLNYYINVDIPARSTAELKEFQGDEATPADVDGFLLTALGAPARWNLYNESEESVLSYHGRKKSGPGAGSGGLTGVSVTAKNIYFSKRPLANSIVLLALAKTDMAEHTTEINPATDPVQDGASEYESILTSRIPLFITQLTTSFKIYNQQIKLFKGSVTPNLNFLGLLNKIKAFFDNLDNFLSFNNLERKDCESIKLGFDGSSQITYVRVMFKEGASRPPGAQELKSFGDTIYTGLGSQGKPKYVLVLTKGINYYFGELPSGTNQTVNELVAQFNNIFLGRRSQLNWTQFISQFLPSVEVSYFGRPQSPQVIAGVDKIISEGGAGPVGEDERTRKTVEAILTDPLNIRKAFEQMRKAAEEEEQQPLQKRLDKITQDIQNMSGEINKVAEFLNKWRLMALIEAALECLLFKGGFRGTMPDFIPGIDPFDPTPPRLLIKFPALPNPLFPIININKQMQVQIEKALKNAAMQALFGIIEAIADMIRELCLKDDPPLEPSTPISNIMDGFMDPLYPPGAYLACYEDYGFEIEDITLFLEMLADHITLIETCDLLSGYPSNDVLQIIQNLLAGPELGNIGATLNNNDEVIGFFRCLGSLIDPSYCEGIYNDITPTLTDIDPCEIEDLLGENEAFQEVLDLLNNIGDLGPDLSCGGGIIPALSDVSSYNFAVTNLIDSIIAPAQQSFYNDLGNFKAIIIKPDPFSPANVARLRELRNLSASLNPPPLGPTNPAPPGAKAFMENLIPDQVAGAIGEFATIGNKLKDLAQMKDKQRMADLQGALEYAVAPQTRRFYENIQTNFKTSGLYDYGFPSWPSLSTADEGGPCAVAHYSFLTDIPAIMHPAAGSNFYQYGKSIVYSMYGSQPDAPSPGSETPDGIGDVISIFNDVQPEDRGSSIRTSDIRELLNVPDSPSGALTRVTRAAEAREAGAILTLRARELLGTTEKLGPEFENKFYPALYFSIINSFAYQISTSNLFNAQKMANLSLFPKFCSDTGNPSDVDLLDANQIKREALQEFVDNTCTDRQTVLGPVRDAGILALVSAYLQTLVADLLLKNIFVISEFGSTFLADSPQIIDELFSQATMQRDITSFMVRDYSSLPDIVLRGAALAVRKKISRDPVDFNNRGYPISGRSQEIQDLIVNHGKIIPVFQQAPTMDPITGDIISWPEDPLVSTPPLDTQLRAFDPDKIELDNTELRNVAIRYLFEQRLKNGAETIKKYFNIQGDTIIENTLLHGIPHVDIPSFNPTYLELKFGEEEDNIVKLHPDFEETDVPVVDLRSDLPGASGGWMDWLKYYNTNKSPFSDSPRESEHASLLEFGGLTLEKYVRFTFDPEEYTNFISSMQVLTEGFAPQIEVFEQLIDNDTPIGSTMGLLRLKGAPKEYIVSLDTFKHMFEFMSQLQALVGGGATTFPLPFLLRGKMAATMSDWVYEYIQDLCDGVPFPSDFSDRRTQKLKIWILPEDAPENTMGWGSGDDGSNPMRLSDYTLIRNWVKRVHTGDSTKKAFSVDGTWDRTAVREMGCWSNNDGAFVNSVWANTPLFEVHRRSAGASFGNHKWNEILEQSDDPNSGLFGDVPVGNWIKKIIANWIAQEGGSPITAGNIAGWIKDRPGGETSGMVRLFESPSFVIDLRAEKNIWAAQGSLNDYESYGRWDRDVPHADLSIYIGLKSKGWQGMDENNPNYAAAPNASVSAYRYPALDFYTDASNSEDNYDAAWGIFSDYSTESRLMDGIAGILEDIPVESTGIPAKDKYENIFGGGLGDSSDGRPDESDTTEVDKSDEPAPPPTGLSLFLSKLFPSIQYGMRLSYITPNLVDSAEIVPVIETLRGSRSGAYKEYKSFYLVDSPGGSLAGDLAVMATSMDTLVDVTTDMFSDKLNQFIKQNPTPQGFAAGFSRYLNVLYEEKKIDLVRALAANSTTQRLLGTNQIVDISKILQYLYITGEISNYYHLFQGQEIFADTKNILVLALKAAFAQDGETDPCAPSALQAAALSGIGDALAPMANFGTSFLNKMLADTPKHILKALVEMTEPHVIVAKMIKDMSGQVLQKMEQAEDIAKAGVAIAQAVSNISAGAGVEVDAACNPNASAHDLALSLPAIPDIPISLAEVIALIQAKIDENFPEEDPFGFPVPDAMRPSISVKGIDLLGTLPYTFMIPPLTPFGIIYLLMRLGDWPEINIQEADCREEAASWPPNEEE